MKESYQIEVVVDREKLAMFLSKEGQHLLPLVNLLEQTSVAVDELIVVTGEPLEGRQDGVAMDGGRVPRSREVLPPDYGLSRPVSAQGKQ